MVKPKEIGGLGLGNVKERNTSLLAKWLWRFSIGQGNLWQSVISNRYEIESNAWDYRQVLYSSHSLIWKHIVQVGPLFYPHTYFSIDNERNIRFWKDLWWGDITLERAYPHLFRIASNKNAMVTDILSFNVNGLPWNLLFS